jgi:hypothetical protein
MEGSARMGRKVFCLMVIVFFLLSGVAFAQTSARCKGRIIKAGVSKQFVINNCGQPDEVESFALSARSGSTVGERLLYYRGSKTWIVEVRRGQVTSIRTEKR